MMLSAHATLLRRPRRQLVGVDRQFSCEPSSVNQTRSMKRKRKQKDADEEKAENSASSPPSSHVVISAADRGHRFGNFHNYYNFHPPTERIKILSKKGGIFDYISNHWNEITEDGPGRAFQYVDVGCNEGDLTIKVASKLLDRLRSKDESGIHVRGLDIDPVLIDRAKGKWHEDKVPQIEADFEAINVLTTDNVKVFEADLISIFSTTMWLHIHGGDEGLRHVLKKLCDSTRHYILIEPQPSKCYRTAMFRLRRMGQPELDISPERLRFRQNIEEEIEKIVLSYSFERVDLSSPDDKTAWNRSLRLYERVDS